MMSDTAREDKAVERWVRQSLADRYNNTLRETLPEDMVSLLRTLPEP